LINSIISAVSKCSIIYDLLIFTSYILIYHEDKKWLFCTNCKTTSQKSEVYCLKWAIIARVLSHENLLITYEQLIN